MRTRTMLGVLAALAAAGLSTPLSASLSVSWAAETVGGNAVHQQSPTFERRCAPWDEAAGRAISGRAQTVLDVDVRLVSDSIAAMRRARRLCALGSLTDACLEYDAVIRGVERRLQAGMMPPMCRAVANGVPAS